jgi:competence protein ComEA
VEFALKPWWAIPFGVLCGFLAAGLLLLVSRPPRGEPIRLLPPPTPEPLQVYVVGAVTDPGLHALPPGSRVKNAIDAAGGLLPDANTLAINQAALIEDGERIFIPVYASVQGETLSGELPSRAGNALLNINTASQIDLERLPGIGPATAEKIILYRNENGYFTSIEEILEVPGIGPVTYEGLKTLICVEE